MGHAAAVLLSGGFDSVAALFWATARYRRMFALSFMYGQPNMDHELYAAGLAAKSAGVDWRRLAVSDAVRGVRNLETASPVVPARNLAFLSMAASHACAEWSRGRIDLVIGANSEDAAGFPDCRPTFVLAMTHALRMGLDRDIVVCAPWIDRTKRQILYAVRPVPDALAAVQRSWSCYRGDGPCLACPACVKRKAAFDAEKLEDLSATARLCGGDPSRER